MKNPVRFNLSWIVTAEVEIDQSVIDGVLTDEWRSVFYPLREPHEVAEMIARCRIAHHAALSSLDGFADQPDSNARIIGYPEWELEDWEDSESEE